jgi:cobalt/nickel transport system permease protein
MMLFAVHLPDYFLPLEWCVAGYLTAAPLVAMGCWRLHERDVPRVALATAAFFIASSIHIPVPMSSVHLVLNGYVGILLGFRAGLALAVGLLLQALLIGHGGYQTLGVNIVLQATPALVVGGLFRLAVRSACSFNRLAICGGALSFAAVMATVLLQSLFLHLAMGDDGAMPALLWIGIHVPVACVEAIVVGFMVHYLARVKPELLGIPPKIADTAIQAAPERDEFANSPVAVGEARLK